MALLLILNAVLLIVTMLSSPLVIIDRWFLRPTLVKMLHSHKFYQSLRNSVTSNSSRKIRWKWRCLFSRPTCLTFLFIDYFIGRHHIVLYHSVLYPYFIHIVLYHFVLYCILLCCGVLSLLTIHPKLSTVRLNWIASFLLLWYTSLFDISCP